MIGVDLDLAPRDGLVGPGAGVAAVEFLGRIDVDGALGTVAHEVGVGDVVLDDATAQDDHAGALGAHGDGVDAADVLNDVDLELAGRGLEGVEVEHVAEAAVGEGRAEDGDVVLVGPVVDRGGVVNILAEAVDDLGRGPVDGGLGVLGGLLFLQQGVQDRHQPVLEGAVVGVGHHQVADPVQALGPQVLAHGAELGHVGVAQALDEVLLDAAGCRHNGAHVLMLHEPTEDAPQAGRDHVGRVAQEDGGLGRHRGGGTTTVRGGILTGVGYFWHLAAPCAHPIDDPDRLAHGGGLEPHERHRGHDIVDGDGAPRGQEGVEVDLLHLLRILRQLVGRDQHRGRGA